MRADLLWRATLPLLALLALVLDAPQAVTGGLALAGLLAAVDQLARLRALGAADRLLVGVGGSVVALVLAGMLLGSTDVGLSSPTWVVTLVVVALAAQLVVPLLRRRPTTPAGDEDGEPVLTVTGTARVLPWLAVAAVVVALCVRASAGSLTEVDTAPLELSLGRVEGTSVQVVVSSGEDVGPLELRTSDGVNETSYPLVEVSAGGTSTTTVELPPSGRFEITLHNPDQTQPLRTLVLDR